MFVVTNTGRKTRVIRLAMILVVKRPESMRPMEATEAMKGSKNKSWALEKVRKLMSATIEVPDDCREYIVMEAKWMIV